MNTGNTVTNRYNGPYFGRFYFLVITFNSIFHIPSFVDLLGPGGLGFPDEFAARAAELRGDIFALQGKSAEAIEAYRKAQQTVPGPANVEFLQRKLDDLGSNG